MAFRPPTPRTSWPSKCMEWNPTCRLTGGIRELYTQLAPLAPPGASASASAKRREHETSASGRLRLRADMPLLAERYRFEHALSQSDLSQMVCAIDTFRSSPHAAADGRSHPIVAIKILNAQHWLLGAQEYERMRRVQLEQARRDVDAHLLHAISSFELGAHFCLVLPMLTELYRLPQILRGSTRAKGRVGGGAPPPPPLAPTLLLVAATRRDFAKPERCARAPNRRPMQSHRAR